MANLKIRLTYLWADESIMLEDFERNVSREMTDWASRFYARYGFELDVDPPASERTSVQKASKYALRKSKGVMPDMRDSSEVVQAEDAVLATIAHDIDVTQNEQDEATQEVSRLTDRFKAIQAEIQAVLNDPGATGAARGAVGAKLTQISEGFDRARARLNRAKATLKKLQADRDVAQRKKDAKLNAMDFYQGELRAQMTEKFKKDGIGQAKKRLNVVFCRFESLMKMRRPDPYTTGYTPQGLKDPYVWLPLNLVMWTDPFVIVNIMARGRNVVAHEIVHAAGHLHPVRLELEKRVSGIRFPPPGSISGSLPEEIYSYGPNYVVVGGGELDGPEDNIMNYKSSDDPTRSVLLTEDRDLMANAFFVERPPAP